MAQWTPQQLQQMAALLQGTHNQLAVDNALVGAPTQRWAVDAQGQRVDPFATNPAVASNPAVAAIDQAAPGTSAPPPSAPMAYAPSSQPAQPQAPQPSRVTGRMERNPLFGTPAGSIMSLFGGKSQMPQGGLMALMGEIFRSRPSAPRTGSVAEMERKHSGGSSYSGGPAVGGEYASGGR